MESKLVKITLRVRRSELLFWSENEVGLYFGARSLKPSVPLFLRYVWQNAPNLEKCTTSGNIRPPRKNDPQLENFATLAKLCHTWKNLPHFKK